MGSKYTKHMPASIFVFALALAIGLVHPAMANWQFTKWGMTPEQVIAASGGKASMTSAENLRSRSAGSLTAKVEMPYSVGEFEFRADFSFDQNNQLAEVTLNLKKGTMSALRVALEQKYGAALPRGNWHSEGDEILLFPIGNHDGFVNYRPLKNANNSGL